MLTIFNAAAEIITDIHLVWANIYMVKPRLQTFCISFSGACYQTFLLFLPWLPCHFYLVVIEQQLRYLLPRIERPRTTFEHLNFATFERSLQSSHVYCPTKFGISKHFRRNYQIVFTRCTQHIKLINHSMNFDE